MIKPHLNLHGLFLMPLLCLVLVGCKKDKLTGNLERFKGRFTWTYSHEVVRNCALCSNFTTYHLDADSASYTAEVDLDDEGKITFLINDEILVRKSYKIEDAEEVDELDWIHLNIKLDVNPSDLDINDRLTISSIHADTLIIDEFPGKGYDVDVPRSNYFVRLE